MYTHPPSCNAIKLSCLQWLQHLCIPSCLWVEASKACDSVMMFGMFGWNRKSNNHNCNKRYADWNLTGSFLLITFLKKWQLFPKKFDSIISKLPNDCQSSNCLAHQLPNNPTPVRTHSVHHPHKVLTPVRTHSVHHPHKVLTTVRTQCSPSTQEQKALSSLGILPPVNPTTSLHDERNIKE